MESIYSDIARTALELASTDILRSIVRLSVGQTVGDYRVIDVIGSGGMGAVYKVRHLISDRIEALKVVLPSLTESPQLAERFVREIKVQARLNHPNIASLHNALRADESLFMVMEYIEGVTLQARLRQAKLGILDSLEVVLQVLSALRYAHERGVVHRDVKPANIMITVDGVVKLMDFGVARATDNHEQLTRTGAAIGSLYYMSPEQVQGAAADDRSDLYSLGITFYEMVTGEKPITGDTSWAIMNAHVNQTPKAPASVNPAVSESLSLAILKAIEKKPEERYQNANEFCRALEAVRASLGMVSEHAETLVLNRSGERRLLNSVGAQASSRASSEALRANPAIERCTPSPDPKVVTPTPGSGFAAAGQLKSRDLDRVKRDLAAHLGPMARILVDRAARKATTLRQLYDALAVEIPEGPERKKFLAGRPK